MPHNTNDMIRNARDEFEHLLDYMSLQAHSQTTAYQVERDLFRYIMALGRTLLALFFALCANRHAQQSRQQAALHSYKSRRYISLFGELTIERPYAWQHGGGALPMDEALSLPEDAYSDLLREHASMLSSHMAYAQAGTFIECLLGLRLSASVLKRLVGRDAADVLAFYESQAAAEPAQEAELLVIEADGKGVPMRDSDSSSVRLGKGQKRTKKKEAVVTGLYTSRPRVRSAEAVINSFFGQADGADGADPVESSEKGPSGKKLWATLEGKDTALERLAGQVERRDGEHITARIALSDGCPALQARLEAQFPQFTLVLDFVHVSEYLWKAANARFDERAALRVAWVKERTRELVTGQHAEVVAQLRASGCAVEAQVACYFERNGEKMDYAQYLARGWPIASGVIEGACRHLVKDRCEAGGMRWTQAGAEEVLLLRAVYVNGDEEAYHEHRRRQRHLRLYKSPLQEAEHPEEQTLRLAA